MLFNKVFAVSALTTLVAAAAIGRRGIEFNTQCQGLQCCQQVGSATDPAIITQATSLGVPYYVLTGLLASVEVGLNCWPVTIFGGGTSACFPGETSVICNDNSHGGLINVGCVPVTV
ncbi:hypothetical protein E1B28_013785 [Marasmius oreades]|uniref:Hydrophobin n=1 Tax=Marasmius oreades TaxID=181124 RepID=A0A9P7RQW6_9AGAR|nr:uncharacterized protein E1B28_013785 [Marasmius oreades]KAG7087847.1 hypothetical protein E1B28_013785 [Marasmius oreades]